MTAPSSSEPFSGTRVRTLVWAVGAWFVLIVIAGVMGLSLTVAADSVYLVLLIWTIRECERSGVSIREFIRPPAAADLRKIWLVLPTLLVSLAFVVVVAGTLHLSPSSLRNQDMERAVRGGPKSVETLVTVFAMVVAAPFAEELLFRGVILHRWTQKWGFRRAAIASSAVFACLHIDPPGAFLFALVMVYLYTRSGTLIVPMAAHAFNNGIVVAAMLTSRGSSGSQGNAASTAAAHQALPGVIIVGLGGLLILLFYFRRQPSISRWRLPALARATITPTQ